MRHRFLLLAVFLFGLPALSFAQLKSETQPNIAQALTKPTRGQGFLSLIGLNPSRFSMQHSYTLSFGTGGAQGLYLNTMRYQLANPLTLHLQVGFAHQAFGGLGYGNPGKGQFFVSGAGLKYEPSQNFRLLFEFSQQPAGYYSPYSSYSNWRRSPSLIESEKRQN